MDCTIQGSFSSVNSFFSELFDKGAGLSSSWIWWMLLIIMQSCCVTLN